MLRFSQKDCCRAIIIVLYNVWSIFLADKKTSKDLQYGLFEELAVAPDIQR